MKPGNQIILTVSIGTEEDDWGRYEPDGEGTDNIKLLPLAQDIFDKWGVRPTYLVNRPPLMDSESVTVLRDRASRDTVEIGAHCPPLHRGP
jgi:hypothetical protein